MSLADRTFVSDGNCVALRCVIHVFFFFFPRSFFSQRSLVDDCFTGQSPGSAISIPAAPDVHGPCFFAFCPSRSSCTLQNIRTTGHHCLPSHAWVISASREIDIGWRPVTPTLVWLVTPYNTFKFHHRRNAIMASQPSGCNPTTFDQHFVATSKFQSAMRSPPVGQHHGFIASCCHWASGGFLNRNI